MDKVNISVNGYTMDVTADIPSISTEKMFNNAPIPKPGISVKLQSDEGIVFERKLKPGDTIAETAEEFKKTLSN